MISWQRCQHRSDGPSAKHTETALDTPKMKGTESSFPVKVHAIPGKVPQQNYMNLQNLGGATVVQKGKRKMQVFDYQALAFCWVPCRLSVFEPIYGRFG